MKRLFDIIFSFLGLLVLLPLFALVALFIKFDSKGSVFYLQERIGKNGMPFTIIKFRTMKVNAEKNGLLSLGKYDKRITRTGAILRKRKIDELPQLINVLKGDMSLVGPRPEVKKYVDLYTEEQRRILQIKPGITDYASIKYIDEEQLLGASENPEKTYIEEILPHKITLNLSYLERRNFFSDIKLIIISVLKMFRK